MSFVVMRNYHKKSKRKQAQLFLHLTIGFGESGHLMEKYVKLLYFEEELDFYY